MTFAWINLSTRWGLTSVQAALNVVISVLGIVGIWSFSRYWWQRGSSKILNGKPDVPLSTILTVTSPGESWDAVAILRRRVFAKENWRLLFQLVVVITAALACTFSGPIAQKSVRVVQTMQRRQVEVLETVQGDGSTANILEANELWNDTMIKLSRSGFPNTQILDFLPPPTVDWVYVPSEWNPPTWSMTCDLEPEKVIHNLTGSGNGSLYDPLNAFPAFRDTFNPSWLNRSQFRWQTDNCGWSVPADQEAPFKDFLFFTILQSDPELNDRMDTNNETLQISLSVLHARGFAAADHTDFGNEANHEWKPIGPVGNASFSRVECNITRRAGTLNETAIPWIWTNDTFSITQSYQNLWIFGLEEADTKNKTVDTPSAEDLLRFYQAYMITMNTEYSLPTLRTLTLLVDTVQLHVAFLIVILLLTSLTLWQAIRYFFFMRKNKSKLDEVYVPDGKMEWMIHCAKVSADSTEEEEAVERKKSKDRDHFGRAIFGHASPDIDFSETGIRRPSMARVYTNRSSVSGTVPPSARGSLSKPPTKERPSTTVRRSTTTVAEAKEDEDEPKQNAVIADDHNPKQLAVPSFVLPTYQDDKISNSPISSAISTHEEIK